MRRTLLLFVCALCLFAPAFPTRAQFRSPAPLTRPSTAPLQPQRKASELIKKQDPVKVNQNLLKQCTLDSVHIVVSIPKQRAYLMLGEQIVIDSPVSSGKRGHS